MSTTVEKLAVEQKITAHLPDGTRKANLEVETAASLLRGQDHIPVELGPDPAAASVLEHLAQSLGYNVTTLPEGTFLDQPMVEEATTLREYTEADFPKTKTRAGLINLGPKDIFTSCEKAMACVLAWELLDHTPTPARYHQDLTQTFKNGQALGQIESVFRDLKKFGGKQILGKLKSFRAHIETAPHETFRRYRAYRRYGFLPHHKETFVNGRVDMHYFKLWALMSVLDHYEPQVSAAPDKPGNLN